VRRWETENANKTEGTAFANDTVGNSDLAHSSNGHKLTPVVTLTTRPATGLRPAVAQDPVVLHMAAGNGRSVQSSPAQLHEVSSRSVISTTPATGGHIIFRDVEFAYRGSGPILERLNLEIQPGEKISLIGKSGSGKTTLLRLLLGFLQPQKGTILVDGTDVGTLTDKNEFRRQFGMVSQHDFFFNMSIKENMLFGLSEQRSDEEITRALQLVNLWDDVTKLDQGLLATYSDNLFPGGQKQRDGSFRSQARQFSNCCLHLLGPRNLRI
jgi:ABC-type multidrug transport system fused ATPase/permease subunit